MSLHIDDGVNVNAAWVNHIAVSRDGGSSWSTIHKDMIDVKPRITNIAPAPNRAPFNNKGTSARIALSRAVADEILLDFDIEDIDNQPSWTVAVAGDLNTALNNAVADITSWLA